MQLKLNLMRILILILLFVVNGVALAQAPELVISKGHTQPVYSLARSADGKLLASAESGETKIWNLASGLEVKSIKGGLGIAYGAFSVPGYNGIGVVEGRTVKLYESATLTPRVVGTFPGADFVGYPRACRRTGAGFL